MRSSAKARVPPSRRDRRHRRAQAVLLTCAAIGSLCGCGRTGARAGTGAGTRARSTITTGGGEAPSPSTNLPPTHEQQLVERGASLFVADGCSACHAIGGPPGVGPSFARLAGSRVTLTDGRRVLVDERLLREALRDPHTVAVKGYRVAPMLAAVGRLRLARHPADVTALVAFIEQIGPESG